MKKRFILLFALMATTTLWAYGGLRYRITSSSAPYTVEVTYETTDQYNYKGITSVTIPETITHNGITYSVTSIGEMAFTRCSSLKSVTIPNSVTSIGNAAFEWCGSLKSVTIPNSVTSIGHIAFELCGSLESITIPNSVTSIGNAAFEGCSSLKSVTIPNSVTSIGDRAFKGCSSITTPLYNAHFFAHMPTSYKGAYIIPNGIKQIVGYAFEGCSSLKSITIPNSVTSIGDKAFEGCSSLESITIPNSVTSIGDKAFEGCSSLESITIPNSVTSIGYGAFESCSSLTYLSIPSSVKYLIEEDDGERYYSGGYSSILHCYSLKTLIAPADFFGVYGDEEDYQDVMEDFPYFPKKLESLTINDGAIHRFAWDMIYANYKTLKTIDIATTTDVTIKEEAFKNCYKLENLMLPSQLKAIPYMAMAECIKLQSITIPANVTEIDDRAFENCRSIESIIFEGVAPAQGPAHHVASSGSALTRIGSWAFYNCHQLENLTIPEGVTEVGDAAFYGCSYLTDITLPSTIQYIGDNGFALCAKVQKIFVDALTPPTIQAKTFYDVNRQIPVYVPDEVVNAYKSDAYWNEFNIQGKSNASSAVENIHSPAASTIKVMRNGQLLILHDEKTYNTMGQEL